MCQLENHRRERWEVARPDPDVSARISGELRIHPALAQILINRGIRDPEAAHRFLEPSLSDLSVPGGERPLPEIEPAVERMVRGISRGEKITIFGDYDADGISATAILCLFLKACGIRVDCELPDRIREGYGLNAEAVRRIRSGGSGLMVTVDCGTSNREEIALARSLGLEVLVLDHHEVSGDLPPALAVVNPKRPDSRFPFGELAGVGVAFYFLIALRRRLRELGMLPPEGHNLREYLDLVALGTVADMVPLREENRILVFFGLRELGRTARPGIRALREVAGTQGRNSVSAGEVGFYLAPRINAGGRLGDSRLGLRLLLSEDLAEARALARELDRSNRERQKDEEKTIAGAKKQLVESGFSPAEGPAALVLCDQGWHPGVVGLGASKLTDEFRRPVCLITFADGVGRGSGRSIPGISIIQILSRLAPDLLAFGGHEMAAGFKISPEAVARFRQGFEEEARRILEKAPELREPRIRVDLEVDARTARQLENGGLPKLEPWGIGNPEPIFLGKGLQARELRIIRSRHLKADLDWEGLDFPAIGFDLAGKRMIKKGDIIDILFCIRTEGSRGGGNRTGDLVLKAMRAGGEEI